MSSLGRVARSPDGKHWAVQCAPHVAMKLKRVFAKLASISRDVYFLRDTEETSRDLEWFMDRYPLDIAPADAEYLRKRANGHREQLALVEGILGRRTPLPAFDLAIPPREYQREAAALTLASGGLLLADDLGVGKTASAICLFTNPITLPALVVTLAALPLQWRREINRFAPKLRAHVLTRGTPYDLEKLCTGKHAFAEDARAPGGARCTRCGAALDDYYAGRGHGMPDVLIGTYTKLAGWADVLAGTVQSVVFDEAQELRHAEKKPGEPTKKYEAAERIAHSARIRLAMTATPIFNYGGELHNIMNVVRPDALGSRAEFIREWCAQGANGQPTVREPKAFGAHLRAAGLMLRRTRADVGRELPACTRVVQRVDVDSAPLDQVSDACAQLARFVLGTGANPMNVEGTDPGGAKMLASQELSNKLRQATGIAKASFVADFVRLVVESGESVVLFGWHREVYRIWRERLEDLNPVMFTGSESPNEKDRAKTAFVGGKSKVLIMSLRSGAGLDGIQYACRTGIFGELDWAKGAIDQCEGRYFRDGQKDPVMSYFMMADVGVDPVIADVLTLKAAQLHGIRDPDADIVEKLEPGGHEIKRLAEAYLAQRGDRLTGQSGSGAAE